MSFAILFLFITALLWFITYVGVNNGKQPKRICTVIALSILILAIGTRYRIGGDFDTYWQTFSNLRLSEFGEDNRFSYEYGYWIVVDILRETGFSPQSFFVVSSAITVILFGLLYKKRLFLLPSGIIVFMLCFPFDFVINGVRQGIAIFAFILGITMIERSEKIRLGLLKFLVCIVIASLFHSTAIAYSIILPIIFGPISRLFNGKVLVAIAISGMILNMIGITDKILFETGMKEYALIFRYLDDDRFVLEKGKFGIGSFLTLLFYLIPLWYYDKITALYPKIKCFFIMMAFGLFVKYMLPGNMFANRVAYYLLFAEVLVIPYFFYYFKRKKKIYSYFVPVLFTLWYIVLFFFDLKEFIMNQIHPGATFLGISV